VADGKGGLTRKQMLVGGGALVVGGGAAAAIAIATRDGDGEGGYPRAKVAQRGDLQVGKTVEFEYPLEGQKNMLLDMGEAVPGGVGDNSSLVAYSIVCQHMGCPVGYEEQEKHFMCPCHQTLYDPAREGYVIQGVAQRPLPRVQLEVDGDDIIAVGVEGLIFGYRDNLAPGEKVA